ncbi:MAG: AtpZ/AtpI family protein [Planctomycetaceae bacterium]|nr:AtpZ/AtpI family protein [Planctomycetaceae bacterium]
MAEISDESPQSDSRASVEAQKEMERRIGASQARKLRAQREQHHSVWFGLGMMGLIGWSVSVPALIGVAVGLWIDRRWDGPQSWALTLLILGVAVGCLNAWKWVQKESRIHQSSNEEKIPEGPESKS